MNEIKVFDGQNRQFRELDTTNIDDDQTYGILFFKREAIKELTSHGCICGFEYYDNNNKAIIPIDIRDNEIALFEGDYNSLSTALKKGLVDYNIHRCPKKIWSSFFYRWQFLLDFSAFSDNPFVALCNSILGNDENWKMLIENNSNLYEPTTYNELCDFAINLHSLFNVDFISPDYYDDYK